MVTAVLKPFREGNRLPTGGVGIVWSEDDKSWLAMVGKTPLGSFKEREDAEAVCQHFSSLKTHHMWARSQRRSFDFIDGELRSVDCFATSEEYDTDRLSGEVGGTEGKWYTPKNSIVRREFMTIQGGCCAICEVHQDDLKIALALDHDHETGMYRGLLCNNCNHLLGCALDNKATLQAAIDYLNRNGQ